MELSQDIPSGWERRDLENPREAKEGIKGGLCMVSQDSLLLTASNSLKNKRANLNGIQVP